MQEAKPVLHIQKLAGRISQLETHVTNLRQQQPVQEGQIDTLAAAVQGLHVKVDDHTRRLDSLEKRAQGLSFEMSQLRNWLDGQFTEMNKRFSLIEALLREKL